MFHSSHCSKSSFFCPKIQLIFPEKIVNFFGWITRENVVVLDFLAVDNFDFTRKIVKKIWVKNLCKCCGFVKIEFLDKKFDFSNSEGCISMHEIAFETKVFFCRNIKREIARSTCGWVRRGNMASLKKIPNGLRLWDLLAIGFTSLQEEKYLFVRCCCCSFRPIYLPSSA